MPTEGHFSSCHAEFHYEQASKPVGHGPAEPLAVRCSGNFLVHSKLKEGRIRLCIRKKMFFNEGGETLKQVAQRHGRRPIPGNILGQLGLGFEPPHIDKDVPAH